MPCSPGAPTAIWLGPIATVVPNASDCAMPSSFGFSKYFNNTFVSMSNQNDLDILISTKALKTDLYHLEIEVFRSDIIYKYTGKFVDPLDSNQTTISEYKLIHHK